MHHPPNRPHPNRTRSALTLSTASACTCCRLMTPSRASLATYLTPSSSRTSSRRTAPCARATLSWRAAACAR
eukprot:21497-Chlamydomonas_euryale.AAC.6